MQTPKRIVTQMRLPKDERPAGSGAQDLLRSPQRVSGVPGFDPENLRGRDAPVGERQRLRRVRRCQKRDRAVRARNERRA